MNDCYTIFGATGINFTPPAGGYRVGNGVSTLKSVAGLGWVWEDG